MDTCEKGIVSLPRALRADKNRSLERSVAKKGIRKEERAFYFPKSSALLEIRPAKRYAASVVRPKTEIQSITDWNIKTSSG
jgi:hypothetical protein